MNKFTYTQQDNYPIEKLSKNDIQVMLGEHTMQNLYDQHCKYFDFYEKPVITPEGVVMSHWWDIQAAKNNGKETIDVIIADGFSHEDLVQFICFKDFFKQVSRAVKFEIIKYLRGYLERNENGKKWKKRILEKIELKTINHVIGYITGYGDSQISAIQTMGDKDPKYLVDDNYTYKQLRNLAEADDKIVGTSPTNDEITEKYKRRTEIKKEEKQQSVREVWDTLNQFGPFGFQLFEGKNEIIFKDEHYRFVPTYAKNINGVLYMGVVSEDKRYKMEIIFEEDPNFKDGERFKQHEGEKFIEEDESHAISREIKVPQKVEGAIKKNRLDKRLKEFSKVASKKLNDHHKNAEKFFNHYNSLDLEPLPITGKKSTLPAHVQDKKDHA